MTRSRERIDLVGVEGNKEVRISNFRIRNTWRAVPMSDCWTPPPGFLIQEIWSEALKFCISNKLADDIDASGLGTTL